MYRTTLSRPCLVGSELAALEKRWRSFALEAGASFFQDWTWVGCLAAERYPDPVLLETFRGDRLVALALFNRRAKRRAGDSLYLHESTDPALDSTFIEHNGPLIAITDPVLRQAVLGHLLTRAMADPIGEEPSKARRLVLSGVAPDCAGAALLTGGFVNESSTRLAPYIDFGLLPPTQPFIDRLSRNTRHQLRRSNRQYSESGSLVLHRAETAEIGLEFLSDLIRLHDMTWHARGKPGAFATPAVRRFYQALVVTGVPNGEVDLLRVMADESVVGYLMNFRHRGVVSAYQSGFNYPGAGQHQKPGLTCHYLAIEAYRAQGVAVYDFLAGADRYKLSLANAQRWLHWLSVAPRWQAQTLGTLLRRMLPA